ncbi:MAG: ROK family protein [Candidatus Hinthialibacter antarcticus]|nr:ROK family protein [Candidatus Hinthialibacter antarcticus]
MGEHNPITDISYVSKINKSKILSLIRSRDVISRAEIGKEMGLSLPTVSRLVDSLIHHEKLVLEIGTATPSRGRPPQLVKFAGDANYVIGLTIGPKYIYALLSNLNAHIITDIRIPTQAEDGIETMVKRIASAIQDMSRQSGVNIDNVLGVGIGVGGLIDSKRNLLAYSSAFGWENVDITGELSRYLDIPIKFDNVARVMALGELWYGIGQSVKDFLSIYVGHGIGMCAVIDGKPHYGSTGMTGELGHCTFEMPSGGSIFLEEIAGGRGIARVAKERLSEFPDSLLHQCCEGRPDTITAETVALAANRGDELSKDIFARAANYLGAAVSNLIHLYNPQAVIIGGGVAQAGEFFFDGIKNAVKERALPRLAEDVIIQPAYHGARTKEMGAVALILNEVLSLDISNHKEKVTAT